MANKVTVATRNAAMDKVYSDARKVRALMGGTDEMRKQGKLYLPQQPAETEEAYKFRLAQTTLYNKFKDTVKTTVNKLLSNPVIPNENFGDTSILETVDSEGRDITRFAMEWLEDALQPGVSFALADYPSSGNGLTVEQERELGLRPYATIIKQENILSFDYEKRGAGNVLTRVNIFEQVPVETDNEFAEEYVDQVRVLRLRDNVMTYELWRQPEGKDWSIYQEETPTTYTGNIPLVPLYTGRTGYMTAKCPFMDIADLNITHWQSSSVQRHILSFVRFPILFGKGLITSDNGQVEIGANRLIQGNADENSDLKHVEHTGAGIEAGERDLAALESTMDQLSKNVLTTRSGNITATARAIDESSATTDIQALANILTDSINLLIDYMGAWVNTQYGEITLDADFELNVTQDKDIEALQFAVSNGDMSGEEYMNELVRRGIKKKYDYEADQTKIENNGGNLI